MGLGFRVRIATVREDDDVRRRSGGTALRDQPGAADALIIRMGRQNERHPALQDRIAIDQRQSVPGLPHRTHSHGHLPLIAVSWRNRKTI
jgi:hypothetical protein